MTTPHPQNVSCMPSVYERMQMAVDIVNSSEHSTNKISASLSGHDKKGDAFIISSVNYWPEPIKAHFGTDTKIGGSSGTIHAESACIMHAPRTEDAELFITDPPCPNCAKNIAEAGIKRLYIDHKGFEKDFAERRGDDFKAMSMRIFEAAGISVYEIWRKKQELQTIYVPPKHYTPPCEFPIYTKILDLKGRDHTPQIFQAEIQKAHHHFKDHPFAVSLARSANGDLYSISARTHPVMGYTQEDNLRKEGKYSFILQPLNRLLMGSKFYGLTLINGMVYSSRVPTSREFINFLGAGFDTLAIDQSGIARDDNALLAFEQLSAANIIHKSLP